MLLRRKPDPGLWESSLSARRRKRHFELDGKEHYEDDVVMARDRKKQSICDAHQMQLIRVENSYARRYQHIKEILEQYFKVKH